MTKIISISIHLLRGNPWFRANPGKLERVEMCLIFNLVF